MSSFLKNLKVTNIPAGKVMTTDNSGVLISSNMNVSDLVNTSTTNALDNRITALENTVDDVGQRLANING